MTQKVKEEKSQVINVEIMKLQIIQKKTFNVTYK